MISGEQPNSWENSWPELEKFVTFYATYFTVTVHSIWIIYVIRTLFVYMCCIQYVHIYILLSMQ